MICRLSHTLHEEDGTGGKTIAERHTVAVPRRVHTQASAKVILYVKYVRRKLIMIPPLAVGHSEAPVTIIVLTNLVPKVFFVYIR